MRKHLPQDWPIPLAAALAWTLSLVLPALAAGGRGFTGFELLVQGWQGVSRGVFAWFANPLFVLAFIFALLARHAIAAALAAAAMLVGGTSAFVESALRERMTSVPEIDLRVGFYVWMLALTVLCLHSLTRALSSRSPEHGPGRQSDSGKSRD